MEPNRPLAVWSTMTVLSAVMLLSSTLAAAAPVWPAPGAPLRELKLSTKAPRRRWRIYLDAGHGAPGNTGNKSVMCEDEEDFTLRVATAVARQLRSMGRFRVRLSRQGAARPRYQQRLVAARSFRADVIVSLHSDARGSAHWWEPRPGLQCLRNDTEPGIGVLMSDEGSARLVAARRRIAEAVAHSLAEAGFPLYGGADWMTLYARDAKPGVFMDRRPLRKRVYMLRRPRIPSIIIETHHALDFQEAARWSESRTVTAFADALAVALDEALRPAKAPRALVAGSLHSR